MGSELYSKAELDAILGHDETWPLVDVLRRLLEAEDHLREGHDCDHLGYETARAAAEQGRKYLALLDQGTGRTPPSRPCPECDNGVAADDPLYMCPRCHPPGRYP